MPRVRALIYVECPLTLVSLAKLALGGFSRRFGGDSDARFRWKRLWKQGPIFLDPETGVTVVTPLALGRTFDAGWLQRLVHRAWFVRRLRSAGATLVWVTHPFWPAEFYQKLGLVVSHYDSTEDFSKGYSLTPVQRRRLEQNDAALRRRARTISCASRVLFDSSRSEHPRCLYLPNGVDWDLFGSKREPWDLRRELNLAPDMVLLGYLGSANERLDWELLRKVLNRRPKWALVQAGTKDVAVALERAFFLGPVPLECVPALLDNIQVCLLPHRLDPLTHSMSPQKLYDYLASGKPVVSTPVREALALNGLVSLAQTEQGFVEAIERCLRQDSPEKRAMRLKAAYAHRWDCKAEELAAFVGLRDGPSPAAQSQAARTALARTAVVIPTYNERDNIGRLIQAIAGLSPQIRIVVVDDASPDGTGELVESLVPLYPQLACLHRAGKEGRGGACIAGFRYVLERFDVDYIFEMDADFSHDPREIPALLERASGCDVVIGSRYLKGSRILNWELKRRVFSRLANFYAKACLGLPISDYTNGFRCYQRRALEAVDFERIDATGYVVLSEIACQLHRKGLRFGEVPTVFVNRRRGLSNLTRHEIGSAFLAVLKLGFSRRFQPVGRLRAA